MRNTIQAHIIAGIIGAFIAVTLVSLGYVVYLDGWARDHAAPAQAPHASDSAPHACGCERR